MSVHDLSQLALSFFQVGEDSYGCDVAKIALDLTRSEKNKETLVLSSGSVSIGDAIRLAESVQKEQFALEKGTKGYIVGFSPDGSYLCLLFPAQAPDGMLSLHKESQIQFLHKPRIADPHEFADKVNKEIKELTAAYDVNKNIATLKEELLATLKEAKVNTNKLKHSFSFGHFSALFEAENLYLRVSFKPFPRILYELAFPGTVGDVVSRKRGDIVKALAIYFDASDRGSDEASSEEG